MQFNVLVSFVLAVAQIGAVMGNPASIQARDACDLNDCESDRDCNTCPNVLSGTRWTCITEGSSYAELGLGQVGECFTW